MARPKIELDEKQWASLEYMAIIHCTGEEMAGVLGISYDTLERIVKTRHKKSFTEWYKEKSANGKMSLRRYQWKSAEAGNTTMQIFLGKQWLGQTEKTDDTISVDFEDLTPLAEMLKENKDK